MRRAFVLLTCSTCTIGAQAAPEKPNPLESSLALGFSQTSGNANALATNVTNKLKYTIDGWAIRQDLVFFYGEAEKKVNANFWNGGLRAERRLMPRLGMFFATRFEEGFGVDIKNVALKQMDTYLSSGITYSFELWTNR